MSGKRHHPRRIWLVSIGDEGNGYHWTDSKPDIDAEEYVMVGRDRPTDENDTIYLQPWCQGCEDAEASLYEPRQWCEDDVWGNCQYDDNCKAGSIKYLHKGLCPSSRKTAAGLLDLQGLDIHA